MKFSIVPSIVFVLFVLLPYYISEDRAYLKAKRREQARRKKEIADAGE